MEQKIAVVWLGYVGLPLAVELGKRIKTIGYDLSESKITTGRRHPTMTQDSLMSKLRSGVFVDVKSIHDAAAIETAGYKVV